MTSLSERSYLALLLLAAAIAYFSLLGHMDVVQDNEGQRAAPPAEMLRSGDFVVPTLNGTVYLNKPPLLYWVIAGVYNLTGTISPLTARIPTAVCAILLVLSVYAAARKRATLATARWAGVAALAAPFFLQQGRVAQLDIPFTLAVFHALMAYRRATERPCARGFWANAAIGGFAFGAALLLKGPPAFFFLWAALIAVRLLEAPEQGRALRVGLWWSLGAGVLALAGLLLTLLRLGPGIPAGLLTGLAAWTVIAFRRGGGTLRRQLGAAGIILAIGLALAAPWAAAVLHRMPWPEVRALMSSQVLERTHTASRINSGMPWFFVTALPVLLAPWGFLLPLHFSSALWRKEGALYRFTVLTGWLSILVFSLIAGKEKEYVLPAMPFLLLATAHLLTPLGQAAPGWTRRYRGVWLTGFGLGLPIIAVLGMAYASVEEPFPPALIVGWPLSLALAAWAIAAWRRGALSALHPAAATLLLVVLGLWIQGAHYRGENSFKPVAELAGRLAREYRVEAAKVYPAFAFYAGVPIPEHKMDRRLSEEENLRRLGAEVRAKLDASTPYFYVLREEHLEEFRRRWRSSQVHRLTAPHASKEVLLIGNRRLEEVLPR